ncbi:MAG: hypothetical protein FWF68_02655 [Spirochaetes bacterium]|nr:hypothetical protein [Spirochaetota bacterium]
MKDKLILLGWIAGLLLLISVIWILVQSALTFNLMRTVNSVLINNNDLRRVSSYLQTKPGKAEIFGYWYTMYNSTNKFFVFTTFRDGILVPLGAVVSSNGAVSEIMPLSAHAAQIFDAMPKSVLQMYVDRIENAAYVNFDGQKGDAK